MISRIKIVSIVALIIIVLFGTGYFLFMKYVAPRMAYAALIPDEMKPYAVGGNADAFIVFRNDAKTKMIIDRYDVPLLLKGVNSALFIGKGSTGSAVLALSFDSSDSPKLLKKYIEENKGSSGVLTQLDIVTKDRILVLSLGKGGNGFEGRLEENPAFGGFDTTYLKSQLLAHLNSRRMSEMSYLYSIPGIGDIVKSAFLPPFGEFVARAIVLAEDINFYAKVAGESISAKVQIDLMAKQDFIESPFGSGLAVAEREKVYSETTGGLKKNGEDVRAEITKFKKVMLFLKWNFFASEEYILAEASLPTSFFELLINRYIAPRTDGSQAVGSP